jgi:hypothetical protein
MVRLKAKTTISIQFQSFRERYGLQLNVETVLMLIVRLQLETTTTDQSDGLRSEITRVTRMLHMVGCLSWSYMQVPPCKITFEFEMI